MKTTEVNRDIIGKRCECIFTGMIVTGVIEDVRRTEYTTDVKVRFDEPHQWGNKVYFDLWAWARCIDEFGTLRHLQLLPEKEEPTYQTMLITFAVKIQTLNDIFDDRQAWGVSTLKEWVDNYESSRFTQTGEYEAVITSEYNMTNVMEWLQEHTPIVSYEKLS